MARQDLKFNQQRCTPDAFPVLVPDNILGTVYKEGFTSFSIKNGEVLLNGRSLNDREKEKGTTVPRVPVEQIKEAEKLAQDMKDFHSELFLLITNVDSCIIDNGDPEINILGYYKDDSFVFAGNDDVLKEKKNVRETEPAVDIFKRDGAVVVPSPDGKQPITVLDTSSSYVYITDSLEYARRKIKEKEIVKTDFSITENQAFLYLLATQPIMETEDFLCKLGNEKKRNIFQKIKENFYYFYTLLDEDVLKGRKKVFLDYRGDLEADNKKFLKEKEDLPKTWRLIYSATKGEYNKSQDIDSFKKLANTSFLIPLSKLCIKFTTEKHLIK